MSAGPEADGRGDAPDRDPPDGCGGREGERRSRVQAAVAAVVLFAAVAAILALTTPWDALPGAVPGGPVPPDPSLDFTRAEIDRSRALDGALAPIAYSGLAVGLVVVLGLGLTPLGARFLAWVTARVRHWPLRVVVGAAALTTLLRIAGLPFDAWGETVLRDYGLSVQSWPEWGVDQLKSLGVTWVVWTVALLPLYWAMRRFPRYWWRGAAVGAFGLVVTVSFLYPLLFEPLFNDFRSLPEGRLRSDLLALAERDGVPVRDVLVADASRRTTALNAYVSGFGSTRRIVVYDTLLESPPDRVEMIVAHELGHAERNDVLYGTLIGALGVAGGVCVLHLLLTSPRLLRRSGVHWDTSADEKARAPMADPRSVALVLALVALGTQIGTPVQNLISRRIEARADAHSLDLTRDPATFVRMQHELSVRNISDLRPDPVERVLWTTHPPAPERIAMAREWARTHAVPEPPPLRAGAD